MSPLIVDVARAMADYACVNYDHNAEIYQAYAKEAIRVIGERLQDHYFDSLQKDKEIIMVHINAVLLS